MLIYNSLEERLFDQVAAFSGVPDPETCLALLEHDYSKNLGHTQRLEERHGIQHKDYKKTLEDVKKAFQKVFGVPYFEYKLENPASRENTISETKNQELLNAIIELSDRMGIGFKLCHDLLFREHNAGGYSPEFCLDNGISNEENYWSIVHACQREFRNITGLPFSEFTFKKFSTAKTYQGPQADFKRIESRDHFGMSAILDAAYRYLTDEQLFCVSVLDFYDRDARLSRDQVTELLGKSPLTWFKHSYSAARSMLKNVLSREHPGLENHPIFDFEKGSQQIVVNVPPIETLKLDLTDPNTKKLFVISRTIFEPDEHFLFCNWFLADFENALKKMELAEAFGLDIKSAKIQEPSRLAKRVMRAVTCEPESERLMSYLKREHENLQVTQRYQDLVDESFMSLRIPFVAKAYTTLLNSGRDAEVLSFAMCRLYGATEKTDLKTVAAKSGLERATLLTYVGDAKGIVKKAFSAGNQAAAKHPFLKNRGFIDEIDQNAQSLIQTGIFYEDYFSLSDEDFYIVEIAHTLFSPKYFYALFCTDFLSSPHSTAEIASALGVTTNNVRNYLKQARADLISALKFESPEVVTASSFYAQMVHSKKINPNTFEYESFEI